MFASIIDQQKDLILKRGSFMSEHHSLNVKQLIEKKGPFEAVKKKLEKALPVIFFLLASISVLTTLGIISTLITETFLFFREVSIIEFFTNTEMKPLSRQDPSFSILPLLTGTVLISLIAMLVAIPIGLTIAIFLSEYASEKTRKVIKPIIEVLAGIPTIVYGFFAFTFVTPLLREFIPALQSTNALSPGIVMGIMIIPLVASLSEDAMNAVPNAMREGALALGATKLEVTIRVVLPAA